MGAAMMRMKAIVEVEFQTRGNVDDDVLRAALSRGVREMEKAIQQGVMGGGRIGIKWVETKIHDPEVWGVPDSI
jgi:hypothetical protein